MRKILIVIGLSSLIFAIFSCTNKSEDVLFGEKIYLYKDFEHWLLHPDFVNAYPKTPQ